MMSNGLGDSAGASDAALAGVDLGFTSKITAEGFGRDRLCFESPELIF